MVCVKGLDLLPSCVQPGIIMKEEKASSGSNIIRVQYGILTR